MVTVLPLNDTGCAAALDAANSTAAMQASNRSMCASGSRRGNKCGTPQGLMQYSGSSRHQRGKAVDHVAFPYRSSSHLVLLHVVAESGPWQKHGLDVDYDRHISSSDAHAQVPTGEVE